MGEISSAFLEGMQELYNTMFTSDIQLSLLDDAELSLSIFREARNGIMYKDPVSLAGKVGVETVENEEPLEDIKYDFTFSIPTKELIDKTIPHNPEDYATLKKARLSYQGVNYEIKYVQPLNNIEGVYLLYRFFCSEEPKESGEEY